MKKRPMPKLSKDGDVVFHVSIPPELFERLVDAAVADDRTISGQIRWFIRLALDGAPIKEEGR